MKIETSCANCRKLQLEIEALNNLCLKLANRNDRLESMRDALRQAAVGELCGIEIGEPENFTGVEERE